MTKSPGFQPLKFRRDGDGEPLVLVHGYLGGSAMWAEQILFFKDHFDVIAVDLPGFGDSARLKSHASIPQIAEHLLEFLASLG